MKRRSFLKTMGLLAATPLVPKGKQMPQLGDLFAKLALGQQLTGGEIEDLRLEMNKQQGITSQMAALLTPSGDLDPNIFSHHSQRFSTLPHECASLYRYTGSVSGALSIPNSAWTDITYDVFNDPDNLPTWSRGLKMDPATGYIYVTGIPRDTVVLIVAWADFAPNATGERQFKWVSDTGDERQKVWDNRGAGEFDSVYMEITHLRAIKSDHSYYKMQAYQDSGGALNLNSMGFIMARLR